jgi:hypothetical protein
MALSNSRSKELHEIRERALSYSVFIQIIFWGLGWIFIEVLI